MRDFASCYNEHAVKVSDSSCSGSGGGAASAGDHPSARSAVTCLYRTRLSTQKELLVRVTWSKSLLGQGLSVGVDDCSSPDQHPPQKPAGACNSLRLRKKKGSSTYLAGDIEVRFHWDISAAKYGLGPEPVEGFYVVVIVEAEVALVLGDISCREHVKGLEGGGGRLPVIAAFSLVSRREQVLGGTPYATKARFGDNGRDHEILIRCKGGEGGGGSRDAELSVSIDRKKVVQVQRLRWNFRGNQTIFVDGLPVDMMWDVHDWYWFGGTAAAGRAAFMFRTRSALESRLWLEEERLHREQGGESGFSLLIHAFKSP